MVENQNWAELVPDLLRIISEKIDTVVDLIRFGGVCPLWRSVFLKNKHNYVLLSSPSPWMMLCESHDDDDDNALDRRSFYSITENRFFDIQLPEARGCRCWGSPFGWLITLGLDSVLHLINPLSRKVLPLPSVQTFKDYDCYYIKMIRAVYIKKAVIVPSTPSSFGDVEGFVIWIIYGESQNLAFVRPGDASWTCVSSRGDWSDIMHLNGQLYLVDREGKVWISDNSGPNPIITLFATLPKEDVISCDSFYLVELFGQLHVAARFINLDYKERLPEFHHPVTTAFVVVYKWETPTSNWKLLETLGKYSLFIGSSATLTVIATGVPNCKPGCVYFTDEYTGTLSLSGHDTGIYNIETEEIEPLSMGDNMFSRFSPPVWFVPRIL